MKRRKYTVYIDETFDNFMNLPSLEGNFCYTGLMIPDDKADQLISFWNALDSRLRKEYLRATNHSLIGEFKSTFLKKLSADVRSDICRRIHYFLSKNDGFISGFTTSVHALLCWEMRTKVAARDGTALPPYSETMLGAMKAEINLRKGQSKGEVAILYGMFQTITMIPLSWLAEMKACFSVCYDSRDKKEDETLLSEIQEFFPKMKNLDSKYKDVYMGGKSASSAQTPGLMLVDIICKEMRNFFAFHPEMLIEQSLFTLITSRSQEGASIPFEIGGRLFKWGTERLMHAATKQRLRLFGDQSPFLYLLPVLADGKLSAFAHYGESRVIDFNKQCYNDMTD